MTGTHIIMNSDPQAVIKEAESFIKDKPDHLLAYNVTPVMVGVLPNGQANLMAFTTCLILWECTADDWKSYLFKQKMQLTGK